MTPRKAPPQATVRSLTRRRRPLRRRGHTTASWPHQAASLASRMPPISYVVHLDSVGDYPVCPQCHRVPGPDAVCLQWSHG
jgi:hypothetical protein